MDFFDEYGVVWNIGAYHWEEFGFKQGLDLV